MTPHRLVALALSIVVASGCATAPLRPGLSEDEKARILAEEIARYRPALPPAPPKKDAIPDPPPPRDPLTQRVTLTAGGVPLQVLLTRLSERAGLRLVTEREVPVNDLASGSFSDVPIREALNTVLIPLGLFSRIDGDSLVVYAFETRGWTLSLPVVSLEASTTITNETGSPSGTGVTTNQATGQRLGGPSVNLGARAEVSSRVSNISTWNELAAAVKAIASQEASVVINPALGLITVRDRPNRLAELDRFLARWEAEAAQQIAVEVRAFEVALSDSNNYGVDWTKVWNLLGDPFVLATGSFTGFVLSPEVLLSESVRDVTRTLLSGGAGASGTVRSSRDNVAALVRALATQGKVKVLTQPSIRLMNGHPAVIQAGRVRAFVAESAATVSGALGGPTTFSLKLGSVQDGVILPLTARVIDNEIVLNLAPILSQVRDIRRVTAGAGESQTVVEAPDVDNRALQTTVRLRNGETIVLGGLISTEESDQRQGLPGLIKAPVLGWLFGSVERTTTRTEIVLTLTPTIVPRTAALR